MSKQNANVCPGCSRHCVMGHEHCKYGRRYFEKQQEAGSQRKWERYVQQDGCAWTLLHVGSRIKKALRKQKITEEALFAALDAAEQEQLRGLLDRISEHLG